MKKLLAIILALVLCASFAACGKKAEEPAAGAEPAAEPQPEQTAAPAAGAYTTGDYTKAFAADMAELAKGPFRMVMKTAVEYEGTASDVDMTVYVDGENKMAMDMMLDGQSMRIVYKDGDGYILFDSEKTAMKTGAVDADDALDSVTDVTDDAQDADAVYHGGTEDIDGKSYVWEEIEGSDTKMYFEQGTGALRYIKSVSDGQESTTEITAYDNNVDAAVFEIPADYEIVDLSELSAA